MNAIEPRTIGLTLSGFVILAGSACFMASGPEDVTLAFWEAARDGDRDAVEALALDPRDVRYDFEDAGSRIESIEVGDGEVDGDVARVETWIAGTGEDVELELDFETVLVRRDGDWLVDVEATGRHLASAVVRASMEQVGRAIGEGVKGLLEGLGEGLEEGGKALQEAGEDMREKSSGSN